MSIIENLLS